jgi:hypothetical protein
MRRHFPELHFAWSQLLRWLTMLVLPAPLASQAQSSISFTYTGSAQPLRWLQLLISVLLGLLLVHSVHAQTITSATIGSISSGSTLNEDSQFTPQNFSNAKVQVLFTDADFTAAGVPANAVLSGVQWYVITDNSPNSYAFSVAATNTALATLPGSGNFYTGSLTTVAPSVTDAGTINGWHTATFATSFARNGTNLILQTCRSSTGQPSDRVNINSVSVTSNCLVTGYNSDCNAVSGYYSKNTRPTFRFLYTVPAPTITSFTRSNGPAGVSVTITGTNLTGATQVRFNGTAATSFTINSATSITAIVPTGATSGLLSITTQGGTATSASSFTVLPAAGGLAFGGSNEYVDFGSAYTGLPSGNADFTFEAWYYNPGGLTGDRWLTWWGNIAANQAAIIGYDGATGRLKFNHFAAGNDLTSNVVLPVGQWSHLAISYRGTTRQANLILNGVYQETLTYPAALALPTNGSFQLGTFSSNGGFGVNGQLDEVRFWNSALCPTQVQGHMGCGLSGNEAGLLAYFPFNNATAGAGGDNQSSTVLTDLHGGPSGTLTNFALTGSSSNWVAQAASVSGTCGSLAACSAPIITSLTPSSGLVGSSVTLTGTNLTGLTTVLFNGVATRTITNSTATSVTVQVPAGASTGLVTASDIFGNSSSTGPTFTVTLPDLTINNTASSLQGAYNNITITGTGNATLTGALTVNGALVVQGGGTLNTNCQVVSGTGSFTLVAGATLSICDAAGISASGNTGAVQVAGIRSFSADASYLYNGTAAQSTGSGLPGQVRNLTTTNASDVTLNVPVSVAQILTVGGAGNFDLNGQALTLLSGKAGSALVVNSGTGIVSGGTATVQRYLDPAFNTGMGYRHYSTPVSGSTVADLATPTGFTPVVNEAYNTSATPGTVTPFPNVYGYNQSRLASMTSNYPAFDKGFYSPSALTDDLVVGQGYAVQIGADQLVDFTGQLNTGSRTMILGRNADATAAEAGWALVGNPYPAPLDWSQVAPADRANLDGSIYVVQSTGPYTGSYRAYVNNLSTNDTNSPLIGTGQGFFVRVSAGQTSGTLTFRNNQRVTDYASQAPVYRTTADLRPLVRLELRTSTGLVDGLAVYAETGATPRYDAQYDAGKLVNSTGLNLASLSAAQEPLAIDGRPAFTAATVVPLTVGVPAAGTYALAAAALANLPAGLDAYLTDAQTGQTMRLAQQSTYSFSVTTLEATALLMGRFTLSFKEATPLATAPALATIAEVALYPNPASAQFKVLMPAVAGASQVQATLLNALGQIVRRQAAALPATGASLTVETVGLPAGVYTLRLQAGATTVAKRVIIK